jgi:chromosome condensin MukBEF MukE localization factor
MRYCSRAYAFILCTNETSCAILHARVTLRQYILLALALACTCALFVTIDVALANGQHIQKHTRTVQMHTNACLLCFQLQSVYCMYMYI